MTDKLLTTLNLEPWKTLNPCYWKNFFFFEFLFIDLWKGKYYCPLNVGPWGQLSESCPKNVRRFVNFMNKLPTCPSFYRHLSVWFTIPAKQNIFYSIMSNCWAFLVGAPLPEYWTSTIRHCSSECDSSTLALLAIQVQQVPVKRNVAGHLQHCSQAQDGVRSATQRSSAQSNWLFDVEEL